MCGAMPGGVGMWVEKHTGSPLKVFRQMGTLLGRRHRTGTVQKTRAAPSRDVGLLWDRYPDALRVLPRSPGGAEGDKDEPALVGRAGLPLHVHAGDERTRGRPRVRALIWHAETLAA